MPNNVETTLTVTGDDAEIKKLVKFMKGETAFDFNKIIPMPEELKNVRCGLSQIDGKKVDTWLNVDGKDVAIPESTLKRWREKHGFANWYDWAYENWGTKWNAYDVSGWTITKGEAEIYFVTAWASPEILIKNLAKQFRTLRFEASVGGEVEENYFYGFNDR